VLRLTHVGICVSDRERSLRSYLETPGLRYVSERQAAGESASALRRLDNVSVHAVYLELDGTLIELVRPPQPLSE
jgi:catechol 2,3-dioxygenase-like lactoylglutathione lyase family enzyme